MIPETLQDKGYYIAGNIYSAAELDEITTILTTQPVNHVFAIRNLLPQHPGLLPVLTNDKLRDLLNTITPSGNAAVIRSLYFDKPPRSNWFVAWHQDITINLQQKQDIPGFINWGHKDGYYSVQPTQDILDSIITLRIHLDDTTAENGALKVIPGSHSNGIVRTDSPGLFDADTDICEVPAGSIMLMKPLLFHSSSRANNRKNRRVIHLEVLPGIDQLSTLPWSEHTQLF
ncbi:MAG: phytanoyl-CoA dioxygenase family protein [Chitinophagales bacterium]|nr:phytanoyl-CoA dioxygenase family protein [Chitinophagales bacterium]